MTNIIKVKLSACQESAIGKFLHRAYYGSGEARDLLELAPEAAGYPHNGGQHTLYIRGKKEEVLAWLELFENLTSMNLAVLKDAISAGQVLVSGRELLPELFSDSLLQKQPYVIYSANEAALRSGAGFWNTVTGWVIEEEATVFSKAEVETLVKRRMPKATGDDAEVTLKPEHLLP